MMEVLRFALCAFFMLTGLAVLLSSAIGCFRFPDALQRMHSVAMGDSIGKLCLIIGLMIYGWADVFSGLKLLTILLFFWMSGPVCSHLLCQYEILHLERKNKKTESEKESGGEEKNAGNH